MGPLALRLNLSVDETAVALGVSPRMVRKLIARGDLRVVRIGRRTLVSAQTLTDFVRDHEDRHQ